MLLAPPPVPVLHVLDNAAPAVRAAHVVRRHEPHGAQPKRVEVELARRQRRDDGARDEQRQRQLALHVRYALGVRH